LQNRNIMKMKILASILVLIFLCLLVCGKFLIEHFEEKVNDLDLRLSLAEIKTEEKINDLGLRLALAEKRIGEMLDIQAFDFMKNKAGKRGGMSRQIQSSKEQSKGETSPEWYRLESKEQEGQRGP
jgi:hypothetical protein